MTEINTCSNPNFKLGRVVMTAGVNDETVDNPAFSTFVQDSLARHHRCDWGEMSKEDRLENDMAVKAGGLRIFSAYEKDGLKNIWIITEADRSATTILFPEEY